MSVAARDADDPLLAEYLQRRDNIVRFLAARAGSMAAAEDLAQELYLRLAARGMLTQRDARVIESLPTIAVPSIVIVGAEDTPFLAASDYMAAKIPGAKKAVIENAGHSANIDQPQAFNAALLGFLKEAALAAA